MLLFPKREEAPCVLPLPGLGPWRVGALGLRCYLCLFLQKLSPAGFIGNCCCWAFPKKFIFVLLSLE